jgi:hypothetical protein
MDGTAPTKVLERGPRGSGVGGRTFYARRVAAVPQEARSTRANRLGLASDASIIEVSPTSAPMSPCRGFFFGHLVAAKYNSGQKLAELR